jgi:dienelactone hydrolase
MSANDVRWVGRGAIMSRFVKVAYAALVVMCASAAASEPAKAPPPIAVYGALPQLYGAQISPSGRLVALQLDHGAQKVLAIRRLDGDKAIIKSIQLNDRIGGVSWADDDHLFVFTHRTLNAGTDEIFEGGFLFLVNLKTGNSQQVAPDGDFKADLPELVVHKDGHGFGFFQIGRYLFREDLDTLQLSQVARSGESEGDFVLDAEGNIMARMSVRDYGRNWSILKGQADDTVLASGGSEVGRGEVLGLGRTPDTILVADNENGDLLGIREIELKTGKISELLVTGAAANPIFDHKSRLLIGFSLGGFVEDVYFLNDALQHRWESVKAAFPGEKVRLVSRNEDNSRWVVKADGPHDSGHYFLVDLNEKKALPLGAEYPDIGPSQVGAFAWFDYTTGDGLKEKALVTLPPGYTFDAARNLPAAVLPHGGPQARDHFGFDWWAQALASRGYVVIQPQFRGSGGFGQSFERAGWGQWGKLMQTDVSDAFHAVAAKGLIDPSRACIVGWSYGGYATLAGATLQAGLYRCAVAGAAVADLNAMLVWTRDRAGKQGYASRYWKKSMALNGESDPAGDLVSPAKQASRVSAPLMLIHGREDTTVPIEQSDEMAAALRGAGKPFEYVVLEKETHHLEEASTRTKMLEAMIGFLIKHNPPN